MLDGGKGCYEETWNKTSSGFSHFLDHLEQDNLHQTDEHFRLQSADCGSHMFDEPLEQSESSEEMRAIPIRAAVI